MATATVSPTPAKTDSGGDPLAVLFGGFLLILFALWLGKNYANEVGPILYILAALGLFGVLLGLFSYVKLAQARVGPNQPQIDATRRLLGITLSLGGLMLLAIASYLGWKLRLPGVGESAGLALFAIVPLIAGLVYLMPATSTEFVQKVLNSISLVQNVLLLIGAAGLVTFLYLVYLANTKKMGPAWFPEAGALLFESLLCATCAFYLISSKPEERTVFMFRCLMLIFGAVTGFILVALAGVNTIVWRQDVLLGGISAWQGERSYRIWICAYLFLGGLLLMFASLLLARSEVRSHAVLRQTLYGYNAFVTGLLTLVFLGTLNVVCYAMFPMTYDWTQTIALTTLSQQTKTMLNSLKEPTTVFVLLPKGHPIYHDMESLMGNCQAQTDKLRVEFISPNTDQKAFNDLAIRFPELLPSALAIQRDETSGGRGVLVIYGKIPTDFAKKVPHDFISERKLYEESQDQAQPGEKPRTLLLFKGEKELVNALNHLVYGKEKKKIYFLQGDDEVDIGSTDKRPRNNYALPWSMFGDATLVDRLKKDNYKVNGLSFRRKLNEKSPNIVYLNESGNEKRFDIPDDGWVVVIAGASAEIPPEGLDALARFVDEKNGKLLVTMDIVIDSLRKPVLKKSGIEKFLSKYGVTVDDGFILRYIRRPNDFAALVVCEVPPETENDFAKQFSIYRIPFENVRVVRPTAKAGKFRVEKLFQANASRFPILEETSIRALQSPLDYFQELERQPAAIERFSKDPLPIAVTVSEGEKPKMVVFGTTDFLSNANQTPDQDGELYYSIFLSSLEWMAERPGLIGPPAKVTRSFSLSSETPYWRMMLLPVWFMTLSAMGLGIGIWLVRRR